jgi:hypothetical protein
LPAFARPAQRDFATQARARASDHHAILHSKQPCGSGEDALSVAKDIARPTLHQIAEWPEQTVGACHSTNAVLNEISMPSKNIKKTWNFPTRAPVGLCKQLENFAFQLTVK